MELSESLKKTVKKIKEKPGNVRGDVIIGNLTYIKEKEGEEKLSLLKSKIKELGFLNDLDKIKPLEWHPEALSVSIIIIAKEIFQWKNKDIFEMGNLTTQYSFIMKMLIKYFTDIEVTFKEASKHWEKYLDVGKLKSIEINKKEKFMILAIEGYDFHPDICFYHSGIILKISQLSLGKREVDIKETECIFKGDSHHKYLINWK